MSGVAPWWHSAVIYQIYPRSFQDSNGDGVGDLAGIEGRLDYLAELGIDAIWISPVFPSPMADFGYDIADYCGIDPLFGSLADFDRLLAAVHARGMRLLLDFVPNHTSDRHPWFIDSRSSRKSPKRDWYIWRDAGPGAAPPNNWISDFGGSAWEWDAATGQYYYHAFLKEQPDLNWRNPEVKEAMFDVLRFWLDKGVDGFRIDVLWHMVKAEGFPDNPPNPEYRIGLGEMHSVLQANSTDQPEIHQIAAEMRRVADSYGDRLLIGEIYLPLERLMRYYGEDATGVHLPFNFQLIDAAWHAGSLASLIKDYETMLPPGGWPNWVLGNHDRPRIAAKLGQTQARVAAMLLLTLRGTPTIYYGDELGIGLVDIPSDQLCDPRELREPGIGLGRDPVRTPMPWNRSLNAGFSSTTPWLPLNVDWKDRNAEMEANDPASMLSLHKALLSLRRSHPALAIGAIGHVEARDDVLSYVRKYRGQRLLVTLNLGSTPASIASSQWGGDGELLLSTLPVAAAESSLLLPDEGRVTLLPLSEG